MFRSISGSAVLPYLCMVYQCFLDDSKDQTQSQLVLSAGFFGDRNAWGRLRSVWKKRLTIEKIKYFKTSEYKMLDGEFSRFNTAAYPEPAGRLAASAIRSEFLKILENNPDIKGIGIAIPIDDYEKVCSRPEASFFRTNPYRRALEGVLMETVKAVNEKSGKHMVAFVHDNGPDFDELHGYYKEFKVLNPNTAKFMGGFVPLDDKLHPPLQLADMMANRCLEVGLKWVADNQNASVPRYMNLHHFGAWTEHVMLSILKRNLQARGLPLPEDLKSAEFG